MRFRLLQGNAFLLNLRRSELGSDRVPLLPARSVIVSERRFKED
jgi:hypothetical protein